MAGEARAADVIESAIVRAQGVAKSVIPLLAPEPPEIRGLVLAELLALFLSGYARGGDRAVEAMFDMHVGMVRELVRANLTLLRGEPQGHA
jgi:hypothetical protein